MTSLPVASAIALAASAALACALLLPLAWWRRRGGGARLDGAAVGVASGAGLMAMAIAQAGSHWTWPSFPPTNLVDWMPWFAFVAAFASARPGSRRTWSYTGAAMGLFIALLTRRLPALQQLSPAWLGATVAAISIAWLATTWSWRRAATVASAPLALTGLVLAGAASGAATLLFGSFSYALALLVPTVVLAVAATAAWIQRASEKPDARPIALAASLILGAWLLLATRLTELPWWAALLLAATGAAPLVAGLPALARRTPITRLLAVVAVAALLAAPVLVVGVVESLRQSANGYS